MKIHYCDPWRIVSILFDWPDLESEMSNFNAMKVYLRQYEVSRNDQV